LLCAGAAFPPTPAPRLGRYFNITPRFWLNLQSHYELNQARLSSAREIEKTIHPLPKAA
jgi:plasmid maintenance system antidote protein VapI